MSLSRDFLVQVPSPEAPSSSCFTPLHRSINLSGVCRVEDSAPGKLGLTLRDKEAPKSECVCVGKLQSGTCQLPGATRCQGTPVPAVKVWGGGRVAPGMVCEHSAAASPCTQAAKSSAAAVCTQQDFLGCGVLDQAGGSAGEIQQAGISARPYRNPRHTT